MLLSQECKDNPGNEDRKPDLIEVLGTLSHEFRTPLTTMKGYTATLLRSAQRMTPQEQQEFLQAIEQATDRLEVLTTRLFDLAQLEAGILHLEMKAVDVVALLEESIAVARQWVPEALQSQITFHVYLKDLAGDLTQEVPHVRGDALRLREVLLALLENAVRFSPQGGKIEVVVRPVLREHASAARRQLDLQPSFLEICMCDYGVGIPAEQLEPIFHPFYRLDTRLTREVSGVGLGLSLCRHLMALHQGRIWAESCPAGGSAFHLWLPVAEQAPASCSLASQPHQEEK